MPVKEKLVDFSNMSGGKNSVDPQHTIETDQVAQTLNLIHWKKGVTRAPGYRGISDAALFSAKLLGFFTYRDADGTETLIGVSDGKVYSINLSAGTKTEIGDCAGTGEAYAVNAAGKLWIVNGTSFVKVESDLSVYPVQLVTPTGTTAAVLAGGSLPDGVYGCYVSYARKDAEGRYLYSLPYSLGDVTTSGSNNSIRFTVPNPTDDQITHKVIWMTDAGGAVQYFYGETDEDDAVYDVTSNGDRNSAIRMDVNATANALLAINPTGIYYFDDRLIVWATDTFYWSMKTDINPFDMERFLTENFRTVSSTISSMFSISTTPETTDLFINSLKVGIHRVPNGDFTARIKLIHRRLWFIQANVEEGKQYVVNYNNWVWGFTNDGFRFFNGQYFSDDLSYHMKTDVGQLYAGNKTAGIDLAMIVYRREGARTEIRVSYRDLNTGSTILNRQIVFNVDFFLNPELAKRTWEVWETGFYAYAIIDENIVCAQRINDGVISQEFGVADEKVYSALGVYTTARTPKRIYLFTRTHLKTLDAVSIWGALYALATAAGTIDGNYVLFDDGNTKVPFTLVGQPANLAILPADGAGGLVMPVILTGQFPTANIEVMPFEAKSISLALEISQTHDDPDFRIYNLVLPRVNEIENSMT